MQTIEITFEKGKFIMRNRGQSTIPRGTFVIRNNNKDGTVSDHVAIGTMLHPGEKANISIYVIDAKSISIKEYYWYDGGKKISIDLNITINRTLLSFAVSN